MRRPQHLWTGLKRRRRGLTAFLLLLAGLNAGTSALAQSSVWDTYKPSAEPQVPATSRAGAAPAGVPTMAAKALARAKQWRGDAILVEITADLLPPNYPQPAPAGAYSVHFLFYSPVNQETLSILPGLPGNEVVPGGYVDMADRQPIPDTFLDLPEAAMQAQARGMRGKAEKAMLRVWPKYEQMEGLMWLLWPIGASTTYPVAALPSGQTTAACGQGSGIEASDLTYSETGPDGTPKIDALVLFKNAVMGNTKALSELHRCADRGDAEAMVALGPYYKGNHQAMRKNSGGGSDSLVEVRHRSFILAEPRRRLATAKG